MSDTTSVVLHAFVDEIKDVFPAEQSAKVRPHLSDISKCTERHDHRRSHRCAVWAIDLVKAQKAPHPEWEKIKEEHKFWDDAWAGVEWFASPVIPEPALMEISPMHAIRTEWAQETVDVALRVANVSGWDAVPWEELLIELIGMES
jgi:hypothetical protein